MRRVWGGKFPALALCFRYTYLNPLFTTLSALLAEVYEQARLGSSGPHGAGERRQRWGRHTISAAAPSLRLCARARRCRHPRVCLLPPTTGTHPPTPTHPPPITGFPPPPPR